MNHPHTVEELWGSASPGMRTFQTETLRNVPEAARRYLEHAIAPETPLATAVRLRMHGEIKLQRWLPFTAEQVIDWERGMIWSASVRMFGLPIRGSDRLVDGEGSMRWRLLGVIPVLTASGPDISRSAAGRVAAESVWLPSVLCREDVTWAASDMSNPLARLTVQDEQVELSFSVDERGRLQTVRLPRWGNPGGGDFRYRSFGARAEAENTFAGYTIPTRLRVGWHFGTERFESEGEFFRVTIDEAKFR